MRIRAALVALCLLFLTVPGCGPEPADDGRIDVVASFYPLAFLAERIGGPGVHVVDLTPPGTEAHDVELSFRDRSAIADADLVLYLGELGFQPQVEGAVVEASGEVVPMVDRMAPGFPGLLAHARADPHIWLAAEFWGQAGEQVAEALSGIDPSGRDRYWAREGQLQIELGFLQGVHPLQSCRYDTAIVTHEAFASLFGPSVEQVGLAGLSPEGEPTAEPLVEAERLVASGRAGAVFFEASEEARRVAVPVARDLRVPAFELFTLESRPTTGDYVTAMRANLRRASKGLDCSGKQRER